MKRLLVAGSVVLTVGLFVVVHATNIAIAFVALSFGLQGPYSDSPIAWLWYAVSVTTIFTASYVFCRWFAGRIEKKLSLGKIFE